MNLLKRILGIVWIALGPIVLFWLIRTGAGEIAKNPAVNTRVQWSIFILIFIPIVVGLVLFGYYSLRGEYDNGK